MGASVNRLFLAFLAAGALLLAAVPAVAQSSPGLAVVVAACGTPPSTYTAGQNRPLTQNTSGQTCGNSTSTPSGTQNTNLAQVNGATVNVGVGAAGTGTQRVTTSTDSTIGTKPVALTIIPLDVATVTTGGTAVTALTAGHRSAGGFLQNPVGATIALCINEQGAASGTTSAGATTCIQPGQTYTLAPNAGAVSVITSDSAHPFSGEGLN